MAYNPRQPAVNTYVYEVATDDPNPQAAAYRPPPPHMMAPQQQQYQYQQQPQYYAAAPAPPPMMYATPQPQAQHVMYGQPQMHQQPMGMPVPGSYAPPPPPAAMAGPVAAAAAPSTGTGGAAGGAVYVKFGAPQRLDIGATAASLAAAQRPKPTPAPVPVATPAPAHAPAQAAPTTVTTPTQPEKYVSPLDLRPWHQQPHWQYLLGSLLLVFISFLLFVLGHSRYASTTALNQCPQVLSDLSLLSLIPFELVTAAGTLVLGFVAMQTVRATTSGGTFSVWFHRAHTLMTSGLAVALVMASAIVYLSFPSETAKNVALANSIPAGGVYAVACGTSSPQFRITNDPAILAGISGACTMWTTGIVLAHIACVLLALSAVGAWGKWRLART
ncbi:hypothetical protein BC828DRAFT_391683 [Blastocladiella britannica]|nr:hypothetical protein BC828DRAFT_391683 [Blastocladiella britannica]